jgi:hypothetical protein
MARKVDCGQFLVIEATRAEMHRACGSPGICDYCGKVSDNGYYIAVLNQWFCPKCYEEWKQDARFYPEDRPVEERNYQYYSMLLGISALPQFMIDDGCEVVVDDAPKLNPKIFVSFRYRFFTMQISRRLLRDEVFMRRWWAQCKADKDRLAEKYYQHGYPPQER